MKTVNQRLLIAGALIAAFMAGKCWPKPKPKPYLPVMITDKTITLGSETVVISGRGYYLNAKGEEFSRYTVGNGCWVCDPKDPQIDCVDCLDRLRRIKEYHDACYR